ncbi:MAG: hypothetical protein HRU20_14235 [Pseudomonadales bacterium]|nr:hypothetical protein [Pseudomonadales bacterium]
MDEPALLELIELANGDVALRKASSTDEPIVSISFSEKSKNTMQGLKMHVARAMVEAAISSYQSALEVVAEEQEIPIKLH